MLKILVLIFISLSGASGFAQNSASSLPKWLPLGLSPHLEIQSRQTQESYEKIHSYLKKNFYKLIDSSSNIYMESEEFGIDQLIVAKVVFGIQRKVEKNPWPTGTHDQFLLKDELTIGFRFGAGLIVYGDIGYIKKYTLVQPVASHRDGMLANDFIVNLMLPFHIDSQKMPEKYVLMTESYLDGRGRFKLGGATMLTPFVHQTTTSKIQLSRTFIDNKSSNIMKVFTDESNYKELGQLLYITNGFLSYTLLKGDYQAGVNKRSYFEIEKTLPHFKEVLTQLMVNNDVETLRDYQKENFAIDHFKQKSTDFSLFGLYSSNSRDRFDSIEEYITDNSGEVALVSEQYQSENERETSQLSFISGEEFFSNILLMANKDETHLDKPIAILTTRITDKKTSFEELSQKYIQSINKIALKDITIEIDESTKELFRNEKLRTSLDMRIIFDEVAMNTVLNTHDKDFWNHIYQVTGIDKDRWDFALKSKQSSIHTHGRDPLSLLARKLRSIEFNLKKLKSCESSECKMKKISAILRKSLYVSGGTFAPEVLAIIHSMFKGHVQIDLALGVVKDDKVINAYNWSNNLNVSVPQKYYRFNFQRAVEIYHLFDELY